MISKINLTDAFGQFNDQWRPRLVGQVNNTHVKLAKLEGEFVWHHHEHEDEMFLVVKGSLLMKLRDGDVPIDEGEFIIVPRGVEHLPVAESETWILLIEPASTVNTGNITTDRTITNPDRL